MSKPTWAPRAPKGRRLCLNCTWRLAEHVEGEWGSGGFNLDYCVLCSTALGGQAAPRRSRMPELPPRTQRARNREPAIKERLAEIGAIPITCAACGRGRHVSADCAGGKPTA